MVKYAHDAIVPDKESDLNKKQQIAKMFDSIASKYDFLNRFLSIGIDVRWRKKALMQLKQLNPKVILDVATGTGDLTIMAYKILNPEKIYGIDISIGMLEIGRKKIERIGLQDKIELIAGDSETITFAENSFDAISVAFGVRNFEHLAKGLSEMYRVLKPNGKIVILEFSKPRQRWFKRIYNTYMNVITPSIGKLFSNNKNAYQYLNDSVQAFPEGQTFLNIMHEVGFTQTYLQTLSLGICTIYCGSK